MSDLALEFKQESFYSHIIEVQLSSGEISSAGFELFYQLFTSRNGTQQLLANAKTGMVCYDYSNKKVSAIPDALKTLLTGKPSTLCSIFSSQLPPEVSASHSHFLPRHLSLPHFAETKF
jgi:hypothetical protein